MWMKPEEIQELASAYARIHCGLLLMQLEDDAERDGDSFDGGNLVAALEGFGALIAKKMIERSGGAP